MVFSGGYVIRSMKLQCSECCDSLVVDGRGTRTHSNDDITLVSSKDRGGLIYCSDFMKKMCVISEQTIRNHISAKGIDKNIVMSCRSNILNHIFFNNLHRGVQCAVHCAHIIKTIVTRYILIRIHHETQQEESKKNDNIRSKLNRLVIFQHQ